MKPPVTLWTRVRRHSRSWTGSWSAGRPETAALAHLLGWQYLVGSAVLLVALALPAADTSDRPGLAVIASASLVLGVYLRFGRRVSPLAVDCSIMSASLLVAASVMISRPMGLVPLFYFWPLMLSAYYASPTQLAVNTALAIMSFAFALATTAAAGGRLLLLIEFAAVVIVVVAAVARLRSKVAGLVLEMRAVASTDDLTGALNRRGFREAAELSLAERGGKFTGSAFLAFDVDHFKKVNDKYGHSGGDEALKRLVDSVTGCLRPNDILGRIGGEEFALVLPGTSQDEAVAHGEHIRRTVAVHSTRSRRPITISVGVAIGSTLANAWEEADHALYAAKHGGRNQTRVAGQTEPSSNPAEAVGAPTL